MADIADEDVTVPRETLVRIRNRVLQAEKEKLNLDLPRGINDEIEEIIREDIT